MNNLGWYFYRQYFTKLRDENRPEQAAGILTDARLPTLHEPAFNHYPGFKAFDLFTVYPGLLIGSGYQHESGEENEFKLGFFFDYVSGLPLIPGSSVKGMLRSCFPGEKDSPNHAEKLEFIADIIKENLKMELSSEEILLLEQEIFEGVVASDKGAERLTIYQRDRFLDAGLSHNNPREIKFLGSDYITPHGDPSKGEHLRDPIPLMFLKVLPGVAFSFQFSLRDSGVVSAIKAEHKLELFKQLLLTFGIGAKTNVGYGKFSTDMPKTKHQPQKSRAEKDVVPEAMVGVLTKNKTFSGKITEINFEENTFKVEFEVEEAKTTCKIYKSNFKLGKVRKNDLSLLEKDIDVTVIIQDDFKKSERLKCTIKIQKP